MGNLSSAMKRLEMEIFTVVGYYNENGERFVETVFSQSADDAAMNFVMDSMIRDSSIETMTVVAVFYGEIIPADSEKYVQEFSRSELID